MSDTFPSTNEASPEEGQKQATAASSPVDNTGSVSRQKQSPSPDIPAGQASTAYPSPQPDSSGSKKRALLEPSEPTSKKAKTISPMAKTEEDPSSSSDDKSHKETSPAPPVKISKENWQGFCVIESDPAYFSVILREMGVKDVTVREVFAMDPAILDMVPQPIHGLIFLFRYREFGNDDQAADAPGGVWFCNQLPAQNSCGTLAMINIIMNSSDVEIGEHLTQFKDFTQDMSSVQRGEAFASFDFVKQIHNSFAKRMDILENDKHLAAKAKRSQQLQEQTEKKSRKKATARRNSKDSVASDDSTDSFEENGHHFVAFVPVGNEVWKLDGMDAQPTNIGTFDPESGETWLSAASDTINTLMAAGDSDYGVLAVSQSPLSSLRKQAALTINTLEAVEAQLHELKQAWDDCEMPPSPTALGIERQLLWFHPVPATTVTQIADEDSATLLARRSVLVEELRGLAASVAVEMDEEAAEERKARQRRFDAGPVLKVWLEMLAGNGYLEENLGRFIKP